MQRFKNFRALDGQMLCDNLRKLFNILAPTMI